MTPVDGCRIHAGWLIDGTGAPARRNCRLDIRDGRIMEIAEITAPPDIDAVELNGGGCTILPCLMDAHIHLFMSSTRATDQRRQQQAPDYEIPAADMDRRIERMLAHGVVAARDGGDAGGHVLRYRNGRRDDAGPGFILQAAGRAWHAPGRYGRFVGRTVPYGMSLADAVLTHHNGADHVKIIQSGINSLEAFGELTAPQFNAGELTDAVRAAARLNLPVMAHANGSEPVGSSVAAGVQSIEHGYFMGRDNLLRLADTQIFWIPTIMPMHAIAEDPDVPEKIRDAAARNRDHQLDQVATGNRSGVRIALGTDAGGMGVAHGIAVAEELGLFIQAGMSTEAAVAAATGTAADVMGLDGMGKLVPGNRACLIAVPGGPENVPRSLHKISWMMVDGTIVQGSAFNVQRLPA